MEPARAPSIGKIEFVAHAKALGYAVIMVMIHQHPLPAWAAQTLND